MRVVGMDIHRSFAQVAILEDSQIKQELRVALVHHRLMEFARTRGPEDEIVFEATGNSAAVERLMRPQVKRVAIVNLCLVRLFDLDKRYVALSAVGDPLQRLSRVVEFELSRPELGQAHAPTVKGLPPLKGCAG
jgi:hypothetical protein